MKQFVSQAFVAIIVLYLSASARAQVPFDETLLHDLSLKLEQVDTRQDTIHLLEAAALLRIVDSVCYESSIYGASTPSQFMDHLAKCRKRYPHVWNEVDRRLNYARLRCETPIYQNIPDVRWELFIRYGPPTAEWSTPSDCAERGRGDCMTYIYSWSAQDRQVICQSDRDYPYPSRIIEGFILSDDSRQPLYPIVQPLVFPSVDSTYDVWVSTWIRGGDFTTLSLLDGLTRIELLIKSPSREIVGRDSLITDLRLLRSVLSVTKNKDYVMAMAYLSCTGLMPGRYTIELKVSGSGLNYGVHKSDLLVPSRFATNDLSDPVLLTKRVPRGEEMQPGIVRGDQTFYADPMRIVRQFDSLHLYHEFIVPKEPDSPSEFRITVSAFPQEKSRWGRHDNVEVGPIVDIRDTLGNPWGTSSRSGQMPIPDINQPEGMQVLYQETIHPTGPVHIFQHSVSTRTLAPDDYWLQISITDKDEERFFRTALTRITVK